MGLLGAHVSIAGGLTEALKRGEALGCKSIQIFTKNQRQWKAPDLSREQAAAFRDDAYAKSIKILVHDSYLINLASPDETVRKKSVSAFYDEMIRADRINAAGLVFHPGSHKGSGGRTGIRHIVDSLNTVCALQAYSADLLIEITSGQGSQLGASFEEISEIMGRVDQPHRMGVCFDTAHAFAAGYDFRKKHQYRRMMNRFDRLIGVDRIKAFHLNDTPVPLGSGRDRHANIDDGKIGKKPFRYFIEDRRFSECPMILETPGGFENYQKDLAILRRYHQKGGYKWNLMHLKK